MRKIIFLIVLSLFLVSCLSDNRLEYKCLPLNENQVELLSPVGFLNSNYSKVNPENSEINPDSLILELNESLVVFEKNPLKKNLKAVKDLWKTISNQGLKYDSAFIFSWVKVNEELLCITGTPIYANELERILSIFNKSGLYPELLKTTTPYIYTKVVDHIYVNLFYDSKINYRHSLGGNIEIEQIVSAGENQIDFHFSVEEKRYIELYIRIPDWVNKAEVEVKKVFYLAKPGQYCKVGKQWKEGDIAHIRFK